MKKNICLLLLLLLALLPTFSCKKDGGGGGCLIPRSVYSRIPLLAFSFIDKDSVNLLEIGALGASDIEITNKNVLGDTVLLYRGKTLSSLKYIALIEPSNAGDINLVIKIKGTPHHLSFTEKMTPSGCAGTNIKLSNFKLENKTIEPMFATEQLYGLGREMNATFLKVYIVV